jgi:hypothetical protein
VSSPVIPFDPAISTVQRPIAGKYFVIQGFDEGAQSYYPSLPPQVNTLKAWDVLHGYWIKAAQPAGAASMTAESPPVATLRLAGVRLTEDHPLALAAGWNLVSYLPRSSLPVTSALASIEGKYTAVQGFNLSAQSFYPDLDPGLNTLQMMRPGQGYWIRTTQAVTLAYPSQAGSMALSAAGPQATALPYIQAWPRLADQYRRTAAAHQVERSAGVTPTNTWVDFYGPAVDEAGAALPAGTLVQALDPQGVVCGAAVIAAAGQYGVLACYGDDPETPADEGASAGDRIRLSVGGQAAGAGVWVGRGERQWAPLGKIELKRSFLPWVVQPNRGDITPEPGTRPAIYLPLIAQ